MPGGMPRQEGGKPRDGVWHMERGDPAWCEALQMHEMARIGNMIGAGILRCRLLDEEGLEFFGFGGLKV